MSNESVVVIVLRLAGIFLFVLILGHFLTITPTVAFEFGMKGPALTVWSVFVCSTLAASLVLVVAPGAIARRLMPRDERVAPATPWTIDDLQAALFSALGLFFLVDAGSDLTRWIASMALVIGTGRGVEHTLLNVGFQAYLVVRLVTGIWLLFGARGLRGLIRKARKAGGNIQ